MPELDSHTPGPKNPTPIRTRFSPWHACGPDYNIYSSGMRRSGHLTLAGAVLRLQPGDADQEAATHQWKELFGVAGSHDLLAFTNSATLGFVPGREGQQEGLVSIMVGVNGRDKLDAIVERARGAGVHAEGRIKMCGVAWDLILTGHGEEGKGKGKL